MCARGDRGRCPVLAGSASQRSHRRCCALCFVGRLGLDTHMTPASAHGASAPARGAAAAGTASAVVSVPPAGSVADVWDEPARLLLRRDALNAEQPLLDSEQQDVVAHRGAPLLVLAGPGTGKTTTLVEAMLARIAGPHALTCEQVLGLTFGKAAAQQWRERVAVRLGTQPPAVTTFHSFAFALLRRFPDIVHLAGPPRLLAGYEEQTVVREVIAAALELGRIDFPENLRVAALTAEFGRQLRAVMSRARGAGISARRLKDEAVASGDRGWQLAADLFATYERFLEDSDSFDYASLIVTATAIAQDPTVARELHRTYRAVFVDEYQDTDPAQVALLKVLVGPECDLVVVGDPDQSIYAFRGADVRGILNFVDDFSTPTRAAQVKVLRTCRRFAPQIRAVADIGLARVNYAGTPWWASVRQAHRNPVCVGESALEPANSVMLCADARVEASHIVEEIRRLHQQGESFASMAVLVRNADQITPILRECAAAGVPANAAGDAQPVATNAAVITLLDALLVAESPQTATATVAESLLRSALCGVDPVELRQIVRSLRDRQRRESPEDEPTPTSGLLVALLTNPQVLTELAPTVAPRAQALLKHWHQVLAAARTAVAEGSGPELVLWKIWSSAPGWAMRLQNRALRGGAVGRRANRDLDAVLALFDMAAKASRTSAKSCARFVEEVRQQVVSVVASDTAAVIDQVAVMTAHRAKGLEWDFVFVAGVQEGVWPNNRVRGAMLGADRITADGLGVGLQPSELAAEERRLFYVAVTRARKRMWLSAVAPVNPSGDDGRASVFIRELLDPENPQESILPSCAVRQVHSRGSRMLTVPDVAARLRQVLQDPQSSRERRQAAAEHYARLMDIPSVPRPEQWWGVQARTESIRPVRPVEPLQLSASAIDRVVTCPLSWFLEREAAASSPKSTVLAFGLVVHAVCEFVSTCADLPGDGELESLIDSVWADIGYPADWVSRQERVLVAAAVNRFVLWHQQRLTAGWQVHGVETDFHAPVQLTDAQGRVHDIVLRGRMDRVEVSVDSAGEQTVMVYDLKTNRTKPSEQEVHEHVQLMTYRRAITADGVQGISGATNVNAGLVLVNLDASSKSPAAKVMEQGPLPADSDEAIAVAAATIRDESFVARPGSHCSWCQLQIACPAKVGDDVGDDDGGDGYDD